MTESRQTKHAPGSSKPPAAFTRRIGLDPIIEHMNKEAIPITRENYLDLAYAAEQEIPDELPPELEAQLPPELQHWREFEEEDTR